MQTYAAELDKCEDTFIQAFKEHPVLAHLDRLDNATLEELLLQRRLVSLHFTPLYERAICALDSEEAKEVFRWLIREEYPRHGPNHREDFVADLQEIGLSKERILTAKPIGTTQAVIDGMYNLTAYRNEGNQYYGKGYDIHTIAALRLGSEVLPSVEYHALLGELGRRYGDKEYKHIRSHAYHDAKRTKIGESGTSHSDRLSTILAGMVDNDERLYVAVRAMYAVDCIKKGFYDQFKPQERG